MRKVLLCFFCFCLLAKVPLSCAQDDSFDARLAIRLAEASLQALDASDFDLVWQSLTRPDQASHDKKAWQRQLTELRLAYGVLLERNFDRIQFRTSYVHQPDGEFAIVQFNSVFVNKAKCAETIILKKSPAAEWQIVDIIYN
jgi:hypothetical protein